ncbi:MAG: InlB B-repeat-containing protein [Clostridia bacterium]|nr:InlB B-repeat-containing protein [Clostridia bacterium]
MKVFLKKAKVLLFFAFCFVFGLGIWFSAVPQKAGADEPTPVAVTKWDEGAVSVWYGNYSGSQIAWFDSVQFTRNGAVGAHSGIQLNGIDYTFTQEELATKSLFIRLSSVSQQPVMYVRLKRDSSTEMYPIATLTDVRLIHAGANGGGGAWRVEQATTATNTIKLTQATSNVTTAGQYAYYSFSGYLVMPLTQFNTSALTEGFKLTDISIYGFDNGNFVRVNAGEVYVGDTASATIGGTFDPAAANAGTTKIYTPTTNNFSVYNKADNTTVKHVKKGTTTLSRYYSGTAYADTNIYLTSPKSLIKSDDSGRYIDTDEVKGITLTVDNTNGGDIKGLQLRVYDYLTAPSSGSNFRYLFDKSKAYVLKDGTDVWTTQQANMIPAGFKGKIYLAFDTTTFSYVNGTINALTSSNKLNPVLRLYLNQVSTDAVIISDFGMVTGDVPQVTLEKGENVSEMTLSAPYLIDGNKVSVKATAAEHYRVSSVKINGTPIDAAALEAIVSENGYSFTASADTSVLVEASPVDYSVKYDLDGGTLSEENAASFNVTSDIALGSPSKLGYVFTGWYVVSEGSVTSRSVSRLDDSVLDALENGKLTLKAVYTQKTTYTATAESVSGGKISFDPASGTVIEDMSCTVYFRPDRYHKLVSASINGQDVTDELVDGAYTVSSVTQNITADAEFASYDTIALTADRINVWNYAYSGSFYSAIDGVSYEKNILVNGVSGVTLKTESVAIPSNGVIDMEIHVPSGSQKLSFLFKVGESALSLKDGEEVSFKGVNGEEKTLLIENGKLTLATTAVRETGAWYYLGCLGTLSVPVSALDGEAVGDLKEVTVFSTGTADNAFRYTVGEISVGETAVRQADGEYSVYDPDGILTDGDVTVGYVKAGELTVSQNMTYNATTEKYSYANGHIYFSLPEETYHTENVNGTDYVYADLNEIKGISFRVKNESSVATAGLFFYVYDYISGSPGTYATGRSTISTSQCIMISDDGVINNKADPTKIPAGFSGEIILPFTAEVFKNQPNEFPSKIKPIVHLTVNTVNEKSVILEDVTVHLNEGVWATHNVDVTVTSGGNVQLNTPSVLHGGTATVTVSPSKGYNIVSCVYYDNQLTQHAFELDENGTFTLENITGDVSFSVTFEAIEYSVKYELNGGENNVANPTTYYVYSANAILADPTRKGYKFAGWYTDAEFKNAVSVLAKGTTGDVTLYAKWEKTSSKGCSGSTNAFAGIMAICAVAGVAIALKKRRDLHEEN